MRKLHLSISGMHCDSCVNTIREALGKIDGVRSCDVQLSEADVTFDDSACRTPHIIGAVRGAGFDVTRFEIVAE
jgi:copper chaperone